jgi:hypothetical protein
MSKRSKVDQWLIGCLTDVVVAQSTVLRAEREVARCQTTALLFMANKELCQKLLIEWEDARRWLKTSSTTLDTAKGLLVEAQRKLADGEAKE